MADGVEITAGSGTEIATDDCGASGHAQVVKLAIATDGSATLIPADAGGLLVNLGSNNDVTVTGTVTANLAAGTNNIGDVDILSIAAGDNNIGNVDIASIAAGDNNIGNVDIASIAAGDNNIGNVDVASSALPTGAATSAKQDTVIGHLDGVEGLLTTIDTDTGNIAAAIKAEDSGHTTADSGMFVLGVRNDSAATLTNGNLEYIALSTDAAGRVGISDLGGAITVDNAGTFAVQVSSALPAGTNAIGKLSANSGVDIGDVDVTSISAGTNSIGGVFIRPETANGLDTFHSNDLDETEEDVKTSAGQVYGWIITNRTTAPVYVHFYNATAANVTVGTTAPLFNFAVPGNATDYVAANLLGGLGIAFGTAISVAATTDFPDDGSPAGPAANGVVCTVFYK